MTTRGGRRSDPPRRRQTREQHRRFLVVTEGKVTERRYFDYVRRNLRSVSITVKPVGESPERVVNEAIRISTGERQAARQARDRANTFDEVWVVIDVDEHTYLDAAVAKAHAHGINVALSNPCFEVWLIAHLSNEYAEFSSPAAAKRRWAQLRGTTPADREYESLSNKLHAALARFPETIVPKSPGAAASVRNPGTSVGNLLRRILDSIHDEAARSGL